ncbi:MAG: potassium channel family protein [Candidatus Fimadaptatus sp.]|jgi:trk system potassium uptake protein TrkA
MEKLLKKMKKQPQNAKQFAVIGLGQFGASVAVTLYSMGYDVLAVDVDADRIDAINGKVTHAAQADATDEEALRTLGLHNFDVAIVSVGNAVQDSIMITLLLKEIGVPEVIVEAQTDIHAKALGKIGADKVLFPERDMGQRVAHNLASSNIMDMIELSSDFTLMEIKALDEWVGHSLSELAMRRRYGINVVAIFNESGVNASPKAEDVIEATDVLLVVGAADRVSELARA